MQSVALDCCEKHACLPLLLHEVFRAFCSLHAMKLLLDSSAILFCPSAHTTASLACDSNVGFPQLLTDEFKALFALPNLPQTIIMKAT